MTINMPKIHPQPIIIENQYIYIYIHTYIHTYIHIYIYIYPNSPYIASLSVIRLCTEAPLALADISIKHGLCFSPRPYELLMLVSSTVMPMSDIFGYIGYNRHIHMYIYTYTYTYIYIHTYIYTHIHIYTDTHIHICIYTNIHRYIYTT